MPRGGADFYFYRFDNQKLFAFILHNITDVPAAQQNRLLSRALSYRHLYDLYLDTLIECVKSANEVAAGCGDSRGWLEREIEREYNQIRAAALSDPQKSFSTEEFEQACFRHCPGKRGAAALGSTTRTGLRRSCRGRDARPSFSLFLCLQWAVPRASDPN